MRILFPVTNQFYSNTLHKKAASVEECKNKNALITFNEAGCRVDLITWSINFVYGPLELVC